MIQITPDELRARSKFLDEKRHLHIDTVKAIVSNVNELQQSWKGEAMTGFFQQFEASKEAMQSFANLLEAFSAFLQRAALDFESTDQSLKNGPQII